MSRGVGCGVGRCLDPLTDGSDLQHALREEETERQRTRIGVKVEKGIRVSGCEGLGFRGWGGGHVRHPSVVGGESGGRRGRGNAFCMRNETGKRCGIIERA